MHNYLKSLIAGDAELFGVGFFLYGDMGVGKSAAASVLLQELRSRGIPGLFCSVAQIREGIRAKTDFEEGQSLWGRVCTAQALVLDDLRDEDASDRLFGASQIQNLVAMRAAQVPRCFTFITSRLNSVCWR